MQGRKTDQSLQAETIFVNHLAVCLVVSNIENEKGGRTGWKGLENPAPGKEMRRQTEIGHLKHQRINRFPWPYTNHSGWSCKTGIFFILEPSDSDAIPEEDVIAVMVWNDSILHNTCHR